MSHSLSESEQLSVGVQERTRAYKDNTRIPGRSDRLCLNYYYETTDHISGKGK
ncbi:hypothetical protein FACS1894187_25980 [Synergistales bacterium]|nr:hypothetical protein FACS1894187_25980 [Synergistales bacterium]